MNDDTRRYSSPPCFAHEFVDDYPGCAAHDSQTTLDVARWRKSKRTELVAARLALSIGKRNEHAKQIAAALDDVIPFKNRIVVSAFWPMHGEPDLRNWMTVMVARGARIALPVVVRKNCPLIFREWTPGAPMDSGFWGIPVPVGRSELIPDIVVSPLIGFDLQCYRLGYGGGYFDRTLAAMPATEDIIGVGYSNAELPTIFPQPHDVPMDKIVTDNGAVIERKK